MKLKAPIGTTRKLSAALGAAVLTLGISLSACAVPDTEGTAADRADTTGAATKKAKPKNTESGAASAQPKAKAKPKPTKVAAPKETAGEANARESAASYLDYSAFSHSGLIKQLEFEGFSTPEATYGAEAQKADYNKQAALSAKQYLDTGAFSRTGLIDQLKFEGYSQAQAEFGVNQVGL